MRTTRFYIGLFLISFAVLTLEIVQTRILSVVVWYHLAFLVISLAMFGLTAGAVWVYLKAARFTEKTLSYDLGYFSGLFAFATAISLAVQMTLAPIITRFFTTVWIWTELALCLSVPFFFAGVVISLALTRSPFPVARVYGVDLLGAASGSVGALLLLNVTDGPSTVLCIAVIASVGAIAFSFSKIGELPEVKPALHGWLWNRQWIFLLLLVSAVINPFLEHGLQPIAVKGMNFLAPTRCVSGIPSLGWTSAECSRVRQSCGDRLPRCSRSAGSLTKWICSSMATRAPLRIGSTEISRMWNF